MFFLEFLRYCSSKVGRYYHPPNGLQGAKGLVFHQKTKNVFRFCSTYLKSDWLAGLGDFKWFLFFLVLFNHLKNSTGLSIISKTININNFRTTFTTSINLCTIKKLINYSLQYIPVKAIFTLRIFEILLFEGRSVLSPAQRGTDSEKVKNNTSVIL